MWWPVSEKEVKMAINNYLLIIASSSLVVVNYTKALTSTATRNPRRAEAGKYKEV